MRHIATAAILAAGAVGGAQAAVTVTAVDPATFVTNRGDLFDQAAGATVVASTPLVAGRIEAAVGDPRGDYLESAVFSDSAGLAQNFTVRTAVPALAVGGFDLFLADDSNYVLDVPDRSFARVTLSGSLDGTTFTELATTELQRYAQTYGSRLIRVSGSFAPAAYQFFRFDGLGSETARLYGGRVVELDAVPAADVPAAVPEPESWAAMVLGLGLAGASMRRRRARVALA